MSPEKGPYEHVTKVEKRWPNGVYGDKQYFELADEARRLYPKDIPAQNEYIANWAARSGYRAGTQDVLIALKGTLNKKQRGILSALFDLLKKR